MPNISQIYLDNESDLSGSSQKESEFQGRAQEPSEIKIVVSTTKNASASESKQEQTDENKLIEENSLLYHKEVNDTVLNETARNLHKPPEKSNGNKRLMDLDERSPKRSRCYQSSSEILITCKSSEEKNMSKATIESTSNFDDEKLFLTNYTILIGHLIGHLVVVEKAIEVLLLFFQNMQIAVDNEKWLNQDDINIFLLLLKERFPEFNESLENPEILAFNDFEPQSRNKSIYVIHLEDHWVTILYENGKLFYYDSYSDLKKSELPRFKSIKEKFIPANQEEERVNVQQQTNDYDCGLFALAFATSLCYGDDPSEIEYDAIQLRNHYYKCITERQVSRFPTLSMN